jgi:putative protease
MNPLPELMAPAGGPEAGYAALHYGADAVYAGLRQFSARADAENFTVEELDALVAYAHQLAPRRRVYVTLNTLLLNAELPAAATTIGVLAELGVDAVIVQDWGVYRLVRRLAPGLRLHASTQLAIHSPAGVAELARRGFARVTLARELTAAEIGACAAVPGVEVEVFVHGALCYCYSGLCLMSSQLSGKSGNRGRCTYPCRWPAGERGELRFSMKDLALPEHLTALRTAGVASVKLEGRKKNALYVAAVTAFYRDLLDGRLADDAARAARAAELQTIFSRGWTPLYVADSHQEGVTDPLGSGHRGTPLGTVASAARGRLHFTPALPLECHDGLQLELPGRERPYGFAVAGLRLADGRPAVSAPAGRPVSVALPPDAPPVPPGTPVCLASSQGVKQRFPFTQPKPGEFRRTWPLRVQVSAGLAELAVTATVGTTGVTATARLPGPFAPARQPDQVRAALERAFGALGETRYHLAELGLATTAPGFVPVSQLNACRRTLVAELDAAWAARAEAERSRWQAAAAPPPPATPPEPPRWSLMVDRLAALAALDDADWAALAEVVLLLGHDPAAAILTHPRRDRLRCALPPILHDPVAAPWRSLLTALAEWPRWQVANPAHFALVPAGADLVADWPLYALNHLAARQLLDLGVRRFTLSPEDGGDNLAELLAQFPAQATLVVYQDTPLMLSRTLAAPPGPLRLGRETCHVAHAQGTLVLYHDQPLCLASRLPALVAAGARHLRADFLYRQYAPAELAATWRRLRTGEAVPGRLANAVRGLPSGGE